MTLFAAKERAVLENQQQVSMYGGPKLAGNSYVPYLLQVINPTITIRPQAKVHTIHKHERL